ncbi:PepSY domain-containing protein [Halorussus gelatinilyticus]|uniref:PepSY domain-containing protein n=1 Tax=Halorussus gelatinilyticus TaxID=2937524 RepID=A0A8U0ILN3_9EURY|nr:PepSY domain-containing protein [Halorussus gelatinilyticus]UPW02040.1 PepSY domain-containing protein [Halorussus gelatinilyticus]
MRHRTLVSVGLALCLLVGGLSGAAGADTHATASQTTDALDRRTAETAASWQGGERTAAQQGGQVNLSVVEVSALEAVEIAQNRTDGKAVVVSLGSQNGTPVYNLSVLAENLSVSTVTVDATEGRVTSVERNVTVVDRQFLGGEAFDYAELRTVGDAVRLVQNETNGTVVNAGIKRGELVYGVGLRTQDGTRTQALVAATEGPLLGLRTTSATTPTATTNATTTTGGA